MGLGPSSVDQIMINLMVLYRDSQGGFGSTRRGVGDILGWLSCRSRSHFLIKNFSSVASRGYCYLGSS